MFSFGGWIGYRDGMSDDNLPTRVPVGAAPGPRPFRLVMTPYRSLSKPGFLIVMAFIGAVSFVTGIAFALMGAWPVLGFFGLDVVLIYWAFQRNYRSGRQLETIEIADGELRLVRTDPRGRSATTELPSAWIEVRFSEQPDGRTTIALASRGREHRFATFLTDDERREIAPVLRAALIEARGGARI